MKEVTIRRNKIAKQLQHQQKQKLFRTIREEMVRAIEDNNRIEEETQIAKDLRSLIRRSMVQNLLLDELRHEHLEDKLYQMLKSSHEGREVQLVIVLLSNLLLDDLTLDEKEGIAQLCLIAYKSVAFRQYLYKVSQVDVTCMLSLTHNFASLCRVLPMIHEELSVACERVILEEIITFLGEITSYIKSQEQREEQVLIKKIISNILLILKRFLYVEPEYRGEIRTKFQRNWPKFSNILEFHYQIMPHIPKSEQARLCHEGLLEIEQFLTSELDMQQYPLYFEREELLSIVLQQIHQNRNQSWSKASLSILINILTNYSQSMYAILPILETILTQIKHQEFFIKLLNRDSLVLERLTLLSVCMSQEDSFKLMQPFAQGHWKDITDLCCEVINGQTAHFLQTDVALKVLIILCEKVAYFHESYVFFNYLQSIGGESLLEYVSNIASEEHSSSRTTHSLEDISDKCYYLLNGLKMHSR